MKASYNIAKLLASRLANILKHQLLGSSGHFETRIHYYPHSFTVDDVSGSCSDATRDLGHYYGF